MNVDVRGESGFLKRVPLILSLAGVSLSLVVATSAIYFFRSSGDHKEEPVAVMVASQANIPSDIWQAPDSTLIPETPQGDMIRYGRELIAHTAVYLGPKGKVKAISNGMNCQNCHLKSGTKPFGNNYAAVASMYPRFRARSGSLESMEKRINDCIERSLNGRALEESSREMRAIISYFRWLGTGVKKGVVPNGTGIVDLPSLGRAADPAKGKIVYTRHCLLCHGPDGRGYKITDSAEWKYPPLADVNSYNTGAGLFRLSRFAGYVKANMPNGTRYDKPVLSDEEAWDVAAYVNSLPRPDKDLSKDWPEISSKPFDHPFGPYADGFSETQHKYGPFSDIRKKSRK